VPNQHDDGDEQDRSVEDLLPDARQGFGDNPRKGGHQRGADDACRNAAGDDQAATAHALRHPQDDADDHTGLDDFAKDDDQRAEHCQSPIASTVRDRCEAVVKP
jgi:hypothetical protein